VKTQTSDSGKIDFKYVPSENWPQWQLKFKVT
jgi:hypothetical protein